MNLAINDIQAERNRQREIEKWSAPRDDGYTDGELGAAAACYAAPKPIYVETCRGAGVFCNAWPWDKRWDKRGKHERRRQLVIAGALIAAEIDRLDRAAGVYE